MTLFRKTIVSAILPLMLYSQMYGNSVLEKKLVALKGSLTQLKTKLQNLNIKLLALNSKLITLNPSLKQPKKIFKPVQGAYDGHSGSGQQWTFFNTDYNPQTQLNIVTKAGVYAQVPGIGIYGDPYQFRKRILLIEMSAEMLKNIPQIIQDQIKNKNVFFYVNVVGALNANEFNLVFHGFLALDKPNGYFQQNVNMGIFEPNGTTKASFSPIAIGSLSKQDVNYHSGPCFSPNNARFAIAPNRQISTFWSVALSPNNNNAAVTYHLLINDKTVEEKLRPILEGDDFEEILKQLDSFDQVPDKDKQALQDFVDMINKLRKV